MAYQVNRPLANKSMKLKINYILERLTLNRSTVIECSGLKLEL